MAFQDLGRFQPRAFYNIAIIIAIIIVYCLSGFKIMYFFFRLFVWFIFSFSLYWNGSSRAVFVVQQQKGHYEDVQELVRRGLQGENVLIKLIQTNLSFSLTKDMTGKEDVYRGPAIRALCRITDVSSLCFSGLLKDLCSQHADLVDSQV